MPDQAMDAPAAVNWWKREPENPKCKCRVWYPYCWHGKPPPVRDIDRLFQEDQVFIAFRCGYYLDPRGCKFSDEKCRHCHVHPRPRTEADNGLPDTAGEEAAALPLSHSVLCRVGSPRTVEQEAFD